MKQALSRVKWRELVKVLAESGSSARAFAAKHDLNVRTLVWWRSTFRREAAVAGSSSERPRRISRRPESEAPDEIAFARVAVTPTLAAVRVGDAPTVRLEVGRVRITVRSGFDRGTLAAVLQVFGIGSAR